MVEALSGSMGIPAQKTQQFAGIQQGNVVPGGGSTEENTEAVNTKAEERVEQTTKSAAQDTGIGTNINITA